MAFIGTDPEHKEPGTSLRISIGISKQGNKHLRTLLFMCAQTARKHNGACKDVYECLVARGKTKQQALIAVASKLARQTWAVLTKRTPYVDKTVARA